MIELHNVVDVRPLPDDVLKHFANMSAQLYAQYSESDPVFKKIYTHYNAYLEDVRGYHMLSEQAYLEARSQAAIDIDIGIKSAQMRDRKN